MYIIPKIQNIADTMSWVESYFSYMIVFYNVRSVIYILCLQDNKTLSFPGLINIIL